MAQPFLQTAVTAIVVLVCSGFAGQDNRVYSLMEAVRTGPVLYRTDQAIEYFSTKEGGGLQRTIGAEEREAAIRSLRSAITLGEMGWAGRAGIAPLVENFPRVQHVVVIRGARYQSSFGRFEDWAQTYAVTEKSKFLLSGTVLEYATLVACENFVLAVPETKVLSRTPSSGPIGEAVVDIHVVFTIHAAACALTKLTGESFGTDQAAWYKWWENNRHEFDLRPEGPGTQRVVPIASGRLASELVVGARYRLVLTTGDEMTGTVEGLSDTSVIFETAEGTPYSFGALLVSQYDLLELPKRLVSLNGAQASAEPLSFDDLKNRRSEVIDVTLISGSVLRGKVASIQDRLLRLDVDGSVVPVDRDAIERITVAPAPAPAQKEPEAPQGPFDTLIVKNPQTDEFGRALPNLTYWGKLTADNGSSVVLSTTDGRTLTFPYASIVRRITHPGKERFSEIERYGRPLQCPSDMVLIDVKPGRPGRPFFKVCMDKYEYPNRENETPKGTVSFAEAKRLCESQGKRLCTVEEWQWACTGLEEQDYPYGTRLEEEYCNRQGDRLIEASGLRRKCISKFGVYDMTGNIFEWVTNKNGDPMLMGGPLAKCRTQSPGLGGEAKPLTGLRCCKSN